MYQRLHVSDRAKDAGEMFHKIMAERSAQKWREGLRTTRKDSPVWPVMLQGNPLQGEFLVSSYMGGKYTTFTTSEDMHIVATEELSQGEAYLKFHAENARLFVAAFK